MEIVKYIKTHPTWEDLTEEDQRTFHLVRSMGSVDRVAYRKRLTDNERLALNHSGALWADKEEAQEALAYETQQSTQVAHNTKFEELAASIAEDLRTEITHWDHLPPEGQEIYTQFTNLGPLDRSLYRRALPDKELQNLLAMEELYKTKHYPAHLPWDHLPQDQKDYFLEFNELRMIERNAFRRDLTLEKRQHLNFLRKQHAQHKKFHEDRLRDKTQEELDLQEFLRDHPKHVIKYANQLADDMTQYCYENAIPTSLILKLMAASRRRTKALRALTKLRLLPADRPPTKKELRDDLSDTKKILEANSRRRHREKNDAFHDKNDKNNHTCLICLRYLRNEKFPPMGNPNHCDDCRRCIDNNCKKIHRGKPCS